MTTKKKTKTPSAADFQKRIDELVVQRHDYAEANGKVWEENHLLSSRVRWLEAELHRRRTLLERLRDFLRIWLGVPDEVKAESKTPYSATRVALSSLISRPLYYGCPNK